MSYNQTLSCVVVLGPRKCGTTSIYSILSSVPGLAMPGPVKEAYLFDEGPVSFRKLQGTGKCNLTSQSTAFIDVATHYFSEPDLLYNIARTPEVHYVAVVMRDPIDRLISHCLHQMRTENEWSLSVDSLLTRYPVLIRDSMYSETMPLIYEVFGEDKVVLIDFQEVKNAPERVAQQLCACVGIPPPAEDAWFEAPKMNAALKPKFPAGYKLIRSSGKNVRRILGARFTERVKQGVIKLWPETDLNGIKRRLEAELDDHQLSVRLERERQYVTEMLRQGTCE